MSDASKRPRPETSRAARRTEDMARDLDLLTQRLAESREAIVRLLTAEAADKDPAEKNTVAEEPPLGPRLLPTPPSAPEPAEPEPEADAVPGPEGLVEDEDAHEAETDGPDQGTPAARSGRRATAARRRLLAVVLVAVGTVILLTTLVSLL